MATVLESWLQLHRCKVSRYVRSIYSFSLRKGCTCTHVTHQEQQRRRLNMWHVAFSAAWNDDLGGWCSVFFLLFLGSIAAYEPTFKTFTHVSMFTRTVFTPFSDPNAIRATRVLPHMIWSEDVWWMNMFLHFNTRCEWGECTQMARP